MKDTSWLVALGAGIMIGNLLVWFQGYHVSVWSGNSLIFGAWLIESMREESGDKSGVKVKQ